MVDSIFIFRVTFKLIAHSIYIKILKIKIILFIILKHHYYNRKYTIVSRDTLGLKT